MNKTKRRFLAAVGATALLSGMAGLVPGTRAEQPILPGVVDMTVSILSVPAEVAPPGELVVFDLSVGQGTLPSAGQVAVDLAPGQVYADDLTDGTNSASGGAVACDAAGADVLCTVPASAVAFEVVAFTAPTVGPQTTTATVSSTGSLSLLEYSSNNTASAVTDVQQQEQEGQVSGLVERGESITLTSDDGTGRAYTMTVPADSDSPGVIVTIKLEDGGDELCPTSTNPLNACGNGFITTFEDHPYFRSEDPEHPLVTDKTFGYLGPCLGFGGTCSDIFYAKDENAPILSKMPDCTGRSGAGAGDGDAVPDSPCLNQKYKVDGINWFEVLMLSNDPIELPPVLRL
jgi:hypothetical protein